MKKKGVRIVDTCYNWLELNIKPHWKVFEWGAGSSTIYWALRVTEIISVEHSPGWRDRVLGKLRKNNLTNCILHFITQDDLPLKQHMKKKRGGRYSELIEDPTKYLSRHSLTGNFKSYVKIIDEYPDEYFNLVFIDGRARPSCIKHAIPKIRPGGYLMLDNSERSLYNLATQLMKNWKKTLFYSSDCPEWTKGTKHAWATTVWIKPNL